MRVIGANNDEVGVVLTREEAALITAALAAHSEQSLQSMHNRLYHATEVAFTFQPVMPMFDWLKKWVTGRL